MAWLRMSFASVISLMSCWYTRFEAVRSSVLFFWLSAFCTKEASVSAICFLNPDVGSSMSLVNDRILGFNTCSMVFVFAKISASLVVRSELQKSKLVLSDVPSSLISASILSISVRTTSKTFVARTTDITLDRRFEPFTFDNVCINFERKLSSTMLCFRMVLYCRKLREPVEVAETVPKVANAASLSKIAMASAMAASSSVCSILRLEYSAFLAAHMSSVVARNDSASAIVASVSIFELFFI
mmetsp:Transcript_26697/g.48454  ORF Transcript_26697/g.48454 Transcript_26697/m.48454 type:complete len:242 (+) Transcript_26697:745-1470(+)